MEIFGDAKVEAMRPRACPLRYERTHQHKYAISQRGRDRSRGRSRRWRIRNGLTSRRDMV
jgi:hypothetical protein